jgi:RNA polymerase sigma-70 factor (ECF subfamily)
MLAAIVDTAEERAPARELDPAGLGDHMDRLYRAAWALCGNRETAEDLVQETYARVLAKRRLVRGDELGYLLRVLRNTFLTHIRTQTRRPQTVAMPEGRDLIEDASSVRPDRAVETREVFDTLSGLPEQHRDVIVAVDIVGLSYKEAAKALGTREGTVMSRLFRARAALAKHFEDV